MLPVVEAGARAVPVAKLKLPPAGEGVLCVFCVSGEEGRGGGESLNSNEGESLMFKTNI